MSKVVLITGATDGIGAALVRLYCAPTRPPSAEQPPERLLLVGRRAAEQTFLKEIASLRDYDYCQLDLSSREAPERLLQWIQDLNITSIDRLYLNAAGGYVGEFVEHHYTAIPRMLALNTLNPLLIVRGLHPYFDSATQITVVGSVAARLYSHSYALYAASKAALAAAVNDWRHELRADGHSSASKASKVPRVALMHPGPTRTGIHRKSGMDPQRIARMSTAKPEKVARALLRTTEGEHAIGALHRVLWRVAKLRQFPLWALLPRPRFRSMAARGGDAESGRCLLIVGAAEGIGAALAAHYYRLGWNMVLADSEGATLNQMVRTLAREGATLKSDQKPTIECVVGDIRSESVRNALVMGRTEYHLVFYTAAISAVGPFSKIPADIYRAVHEVNLCAPTLLIRSLLSQKVIRSGSRVVLFSSLSHYSGYPGAALYSATKSGVAILGAALNGARTRDGVAYSVVFPGPVRTAHARRYSPTNEREHKRTDPQEVARLIARGVANGRTRIIPNWRTTLIALLGFCAPTVTAAIIRRALYQKVTTPLLPP